MCLNWLFRIKPVSYIFMVGLFYYLCPWTIHVLKPSPTRLASVASYFFFSTDEIFFLRKTQQWNELITRLKITIFDNNSYIEAFTHSIGKCSQLLFFKFSTDFFFFFNWRKFVSESENSTVKWIYNKIYESIWGRGTMKNIQTFSSMRILLVKKSDKKLRTIEMFIKK